MLWGSQLTIDQTFSFYSAQLQTLGWVPDFGPTLSSGELRGWGWCKPRMFFRLAIFDPANYDRRASRTEQPTAWFDAGINGTVRACPYSAPPFPTLPPPRP